MSLVIAINVFLRFFTCHYNWLSFFQNVSIAVVGKDQPFKVYEDAAVDPYLELIAGEERRGGAAATAEGEGQGQGQDEGSMDTD